MDIGRVAYEGYLASCEGKSIRGEDLPPWGGQAPEIREHWRASADAVTMFLDLLGGALPAPPAADEAGPEPGGADLSRFDCDPDAVAWARGKVVKVRDQFRGFQRKAAAAGKAEQAEMWRRMANMLDLKLIGGTTCVITAFDERLPAMAKLRDGTDERNGE